MLQDTVCSNSTLLKLYCGDWVKRCVRNPNGTGTDHLNPHLQLKTFELMVLKCYGVTSLWSFILMRWCFATSIQFFAFVRFELNSTISIQIQFLLRDNMFECRKNFIRFQPSIMFHLWLLYYRRCIFFRRASALVCDHWQIWIIVICKGGAL
jgi:hypothetical protein